MILVVNQLGRGAVEIDIDIEISRTAPVISAIRAAESIPISIDTRKAKVAEAAALAGANIVNDVFWVLLLTQILVALCRDRRLACDCDACRRGVAADDAGQSAV